MSIFVSAVNLPFEIVLLVWTRVWTWTYPLATPAVDELRSGVRTDHKNWATFIEFISLFFHLPFMARSQHYAERSGATGSAIETGEDPVSESYASYLTRWRAETLWHTRLRELIVWSTLASWLISYGAIGASVVFTGDFLFETHETPEAAGYVSNYFKVAALSFVAPFAWILAGLGTLRASRHRI